MILFLTSNMNQLKALTGRLTGNPGLLFNDDPRDHIDEDFGVSMGGYKPKYSSLSYFQYQYDQAPNNTCTQVATALALSEQMSVRFAIDPITKLLVKQGKISQNGFCSQQPPMGVAVNDGLIPYHLLPDVEHEPWSSKKKWTASVEKAYAETSPLFKMTRYKRLRNEQAVLEALDAGFVPIVASKWHSAMNRPLPPNFFLLFNGYVIGGHQYRITGYRKDGADFENGQSFGERYGDHGKSYNETLFGSGYYAVYIVEYNGSPFLPMEVLLPAFLAQREGQMVRAHQHLADAPECYVIENGKKRWVSGEDGMRTFQRLFREKGLQYVKKEVLEAVPTGDHYPLT